MLVLKRKCGQWVEIRHKSGDLIRVRIYDVRVDGVGRVNMAFDDAARNFEIERPERFWRSTEGPGPVDEPAERPDGEDIRAGERASIELYD